MKAMTLNAIEGCFRRHPSMPGRTPMFEVDHFFNGRRQRGIDCSEADVRRWANDRRYSILSIKPLASGITQEERTAGILAFGTAD